MQSIAYNTYSTKHHSVDLDDIFSSSDDEEIEEENTTKQTPIPKARKSNRLIISNLSDSTNSDQLLDLCSKYGSITDIYLPMNRDDNSKHRGFGYVSFGTNEESDFAKSNIHGIKLDNNKLRVGYANANKAKEKEYLNKQYSQNFKPFNSYFAEIS